MLNVLEYGLDRATDPNENKVNQVRQLVCCFFFLFYFIFFPHLLNLFGRTQTMSLGLSFFGHHRLSELAQL